MREQKKGVSTVTIRLKAKEMAQQKPISDFKGNFKWCYNFMKRKRSSSSLPTDW
jgi:hypothetical protein